MKVLVTGGGGFLGGAVVRRLLDRGNTVRSLQRGDYAWLDEAGVESIRGDLADRDTVERAVRGCDAVLHVAAKAGVWGPRREYEAANVTGTRHVIEACLREGVARLVYTSSPSVVFDGADEEGIDERAAYPHRYLADYPRTKALAEQAVLAANGPRLATLALRPHLIWGPGDPHLVPRIVARARAGRLRLVGSGANRVDSTYIDNAADAHLAALDRLAPGAACAGRAYFISNGQPLPMRELVGRILAAAGLPRELRSLPPPLAYALATALEGAWRMLRRVDEPPLTRFVVRQLATAHWFDLTAARRDLGYEPRVTLDEGFARLRAWLEGGAPGPSLLPSGTGIVHAARSQPVQRQ